jgi:tRNA-modifying protein YgfZ
MTAPQENSLVHAFSPAAVLRVSGEDALPFLQGQFTNELRHPGGRLCRYGLWLSQKGKVLADSFALRDGSAWWLVSTHSSSTSIRERLEAYIIADDVQVEDVTSQWTGWLLGAEAGRTLASRLHMSLPEADSWGGDGMFLFRSRRIPDAWELMVPAGRDLTGVGELQSNANEVDVERSRIASGLPLVPADLGPNDLPNEGGLEEIAVSYTKGCYLGQEVMARLKSMGQVRRRLHVVETQSDPLAPGADLFVGSKKAGEVRSTAPKPGGGSVALAMISLINAQGVNALSSQPEAPPTVKLVRPI